MPLHRPARQAWFRTGREGEAPGAGQAHHPVESPTHVLVLERDSPGLFSGNKSGS